MKAIAVAIAALLAGIASAQFQQLPVCAQNCTTNAIPSSCNLNPKCICSDAGFIKAITCCVALACDAADQASTIKYAQSICVPAGVTNLPTAATCANSTASSTAGASGPTVSSMSMTGSAASSAATSSYTGASSLNSAVSNAPSSALSSAASAASASASGTNEGSKYVVQGLMGLGAAAAAVAAFV